jgi:hypothetical protein
MASTRIGILTSAVGECCCHVRASCVFNDFDAPLNMPTKSQTTSPSILYRSGTTIGNKHQHNEAEVQESGIEPGM